MMIVKLYILWKLIFLVDYLRVNQKLKIQMF